MKYEPAFDGLRALAVAGVIAVHVGVKMPGGGTGVDIFFALSGFLITRILLDEEDRTGRIDIKRFYIRRALRLLPALVALLVVLTAWSLTWGGHVREQAVSSLISLFYVMNLNRAFGWGPELHLGHTWSLSMEEQFYLLWPALLLLAPKVHRFKITIIMIAAVCVWRAFLLWNGASIDRVYHGFDTHSEVLLMGCAVAMSERHMSERAKSIISRWIAVPIVFFVLDCAFMPVTTGLGQAVGLPMVGLATCWLIIALPRSEFTRNILSWIPVVYIGRISYGLYLWHYPILSIARSEGVPFAGSITPFATVIVAVLSYQLIERPFLLAKNRLASAKSIPENGSDRVSL